MSNNATHDTPASQHPSEGQSDRPCLQYRIGELLIVELDSKPHDRTWTLYRDLDIIAIWVGLSEQDRRRALAEALAELVDQQ